MRKIFLLTMLSISLLYANFYAEEPELKYVSAWIQNLNHSDIIVRNDAAEKLIMLGEEVVSVVIKDFSKDHYIVKRQKVYICGRIASSKAILFLIECIGDEDAGVRNTAARMLLNISEQYPLYEKLQQISHKQTNPMVREKIQDLINSILYKEVEKEIIFYVSPDGASGYFTGQFKNLEKKWGYRAIIPLLDIFKDENYRYINTLVTKDDAFQIRYLAGEGLADLKKSYNQNLRRKVKMELQKMKSGLVRRQFNDDYLQGLMDFILYSIGYTKEFDAEVERMKRNLRVNPNNSMLLYRLGMKFLRIRKLDEGIAYLKKAIAIDYTNDIYYYNLACAYSVARRIEEAIDALEKSVFHGYEDVDWMLKDGDLRNIRKHPRFLKLVKKLKDKG